MTSRRLGYEELLAARARAVRERRTDFTVAVEEEFALLDPATLGLVNRFEDCRPLRRARRSSQHLVGELIALRGRGRAPGAARRSPRSPPRWRSAARSCSALAEPLGIALGATGTHPWAPWQEQRIIDTPHYRRNDELLRYVVWRNNTFGLHVHVGIRGADRAIAVMQRACSNLLPELLALSASSPFVERREHGPATPRAPQIFTRFFPRCGVPDAFASGSGIEDYVRFLYEHGLDHRAHADLVERPAAPRRSRRSRSGSATGSQTSAESAGARRVRALAPAPRGSRARSTRAEPLADQPHRLIEENIWRAIRYGLSRRADRPRTRGATRLPTRARSSGCSSGVGPVAEEIGAAPYLAVPRANAAERQIARFEEGASLEEIYAEQVVGSRSVADEEQISERSTPRGPPAAAGLRPARADAVDRLARSRITGSSEEHRDLEQARLAIEALRALRARCSPARYPPTSSRDFEQVTANLQLAYAARRHSRSVKPGHAPPLVIHNPPRRDSLGAHFVDGKYQTEG